MAIREAPQSSDVTRRALALLLPRLDSLDVVAPGSYRPGPDDERAHQALAEIRAQLAPVSVQEIAIELDRIIAVLQCQTPSTDAFEFYYGVLSRYPFEAVHTAATKLMETARFRIMPTPAEFIEAIGKVPGYARLVRLEQRAAALAWQHDVHNADARCAAATMALRRAGTPEEAKAAIGLATDTLDSVRRYEGNVAGLLAAIHDTLKKLPH